MIAVSMLAIRVLVAAVYVTLAIVAPDCAVEWAFAYAVLVLGVAVVDLVRARRRA